MKDKIQIALLAVIAVALGVIAWGQLKDSGSDTSAPPVVAATASTANPATPAPTTFDPMQQAGEVVDNKPKTTVNFANYEHDFGNIKHYPRSHWIRGGKVEDYDAYLAHEKERIRKEMAELLREGGQ